MISRLEAMCLLTIVVLAMPGGLGVAAPAPEALTASPETRAEPGAHAPTTAEILERFDRAQRETVTLVARFTEEKSLRLLARPVVSHGRFFYTRPNQVRWEYEAPERRVFVITESSYVAYFPTEKRAENVEIKKFIGKRLFRFLAVGQSTQDLAKYYNIARLVDGTTRDSYLMVLTPRRERVREHLAVLRIWVDAGTFLPRRVTYEEPDGDSTSLTFEDLRPNVDLPERAFRVDLPSDVLISSTFNGLGLGQAGGL